jgi:hypothetical protein
MTASQSTFDAAYTAGTTLESENTTPSISEAVAIASLRMSIIPSMFVALPTVFQNQRVAAKCREPETPTGIMHFFPPRDLARVQVSKVTAA